LLRFWYSEKHEEKKTEPSCNIKEHQHTLKSIHVVGDGIKEKQGDHAQEQGGHGLR